jgi:uncharacterized protein involved in exopolysaccharide biosynthesis
MTTIEFSPHAYFARVMKTWWLVLLATFLGGVFGFVFFHLHPPVYEATATYFVTLDLTRFPKLGVREDLIQYNEDMALGTTQGALISTEVLKELISQAHNLGQNLTEKKLLADTTIERKLDTWELRYRSRDPAIAQTIVNIWAELGYQAMLSWQASGTTPAYVVFQPPTLAPLPDHPILYGRNNLMLAGALVGLIIGILVSALMQPVPKKSRQTSANETGSPGAVGGTV